jgi:hypothetical protein
MKNLELQSLGLRELDAKENMEMEGGFIPLLIFGVLYSAKVVAGVCLLSAAAGVACGVAVYSHN